MFKIVKAKNQFYNPDIKKEFLHKVSAQTSQEQVFKNVYHYEKKLGKDLYNFNLKEIEDLLESLDLKTYNYVRLHITNIKSYINFAIYSNLREDKKNPLVNVGSEWIKKFAKDAIYITEDELNNKINNCVNGQDSVILRLIFEGVNGYKHSEILNLKKSDINYKSNVLHLKDDKKGERTLQVSEICINLIKKAAYEDKYIQQNGKSLARNPIVRLEMNDYVIRNSLKGKAKKENDRADQHLIHRRLSVLSNVFELPLLSKAKRIEQSGMIKVAKEVYEKYGMINEQKALEEINNRFNHEKIKYKKWEIYKGYLREYVKAETISIVYGIEYNDEIQPFELIDESNKATSFRDSGDVTIRLKQDFFRESIFFNYDGLCAITGEKTPQILEAAHIQKYINENSHHHQNGILLRTDFHKLFDKGLITINEQYKIIISSKLKSEYYSSFHKKEIYLPRNISLRPSLVALRNHRIKVFIE